MARFIALNLPPPTLDWRWYWLKELLKEKFTDGSDRDQFRRIIRYLKRWANYNFSSTGAERPTGMSLTACCYTLFMPQKEIAYNQYTSTYNYQCKDLQALYNVVCRMISAFGWSSRISINLPVQPYNDLFAKMNDNQMVSMKTKLITLRDTLLSASNDYLLSSACAKLQKVFGSDFPSS